jgi:hypothetical protein
MPWTSNAAIAVSVALLVLASASAGSARAEGVYSSGLFELGDGQPPPGMPGLADVLATEDQSGPDWASLFAADGTARDDHPLNPDGSQGNGIPDYLELYQGLWAIFEADYVSLGSGFEGSAIAENGGVRNGVVAADHDLGNAYVYTTVDAGGSLVFYAATERLGAGDSFVEFELNQQRFRLGRGGYGVGRPWEVLGNRLPGDLRLHLQFAGGALSRVDALAWNGGDWALFSSVAGQGCDGEEALCAVANAALVDGGPWPNHDTGGDAEQISPNRFVEIGVNVGALLGAQPEYVTVSIRTPQDIAFGYLGEGN